MTSDVEVLIVGGGPAGLTASLLLSRHGVSSLLVDKRTAASPLPRARGVHSRAMEILRVCGVEADLRALQLPIEPGAEWRESLAAPPFRTSEMGKATEVSPCEGLALSQDVFEDVLREHAEGWANAELRRGVELESFETGSGVDAVLLDHASGRRETVHARYLIAADGARGGIRQRLGIGLSGDSDLGTHNMIAFRADLTPWTGQPRGIYFLTGAAAALIWTHPDDRWVLHLPGTLDDPADAVRAALGLPGLGLEILACRPWTAVAETAERYADGPVFLVGDAAHRFPPAGATGLSTALHDVHNLAWKLAAVLRGRAGEALLGTYREEREPVGRVTAAETAGAWSAIWNPGAEPFAGRSLRQLDMGYQYASAAISAEDGPDADPPGADYVPSAAPGCRAPHFWVEPGLSTIDLFDREPVLLTASGGWEAAGVRVHIVRAPEFPELYGVTGEGAALVRPDGHVAWRSKGLAPGEVAAVARKVMAKDS